MESLDGDPNQCSRCSTSPDPSSSMDEATEAVYAGEGGRMTATEVAKDILQ